ncbi:pectate lyase [Stenotrophomonas cyclobalanopsidis]|uniref:Pectate lyase n=2 Tax=Stenotrophomonas cyclobalanopsidis TaxID=2771362 RepID=A0ABQ6T0U4_9GAMM|nr:pectate lyase [Stenotrophomonas cyclobalanopsidis]
MAAGRAARMIRRRALPLLLGVGMAATAAHAAPPAATPAIPVGRFNDGVNHWRSGHAAAYARLDPQQYRQIADNLLVLQRRSGGWPVNQDPLRVLDAAAREAARAAQDEPGGSFDNRTTYTQVDYLAEAFARSNDRRYRDAALRGLDFILDQQIRSCGGWPHSVPARTDYHDRITFADDVTSGVLATLRQVQDAPRFAFVDAARRARVATAVQRGDECLLRLQVRQHGQPTLWAGQYDATTLQPAPGRKFELAALVTDESVGVVRYLMSIPDPSPQTVQAIEGALAWFQANALRGLRLQTVDAPAEQFAHHRSTVDRRLLADPAAPLLWGRFHDLADNSVVLANRQGERLQNYEQVGRERRTGYHWYGTWPQALLDHDAPAWRARIGRPAA